MQTLVVNVLEPNVVQSDHQLKLQVNRFQLEPAQPESIVESNNKDIS